MERLDFTTDGGAIDTEDAALDAKLPLIADLQRTLGEKPEVTEAYLDTLRWIARFYAGAFSELAVLAVSDLADSAQGASLLHRAIHANILPHEALAEAVRESGIYLLSQVRLMNPPLPAPFDRVEFVFKRSGAGLMASPTLRTYTLVHCDPFLARSSLRAVQKILDSSGEPRRVGQCIVSCEV